MRSFLRQPILTGMARAPTWQGTTLQLVTAEQRHLMGLSHHLFN
jgi:hypothetical protein